MLKITTVRTGQSDWSGSVINIGMLTHHIRCRMNRKAPGTTRSSLPTLHRRRNTTIPGISSSGSFGRSYFPFNQPRRSTIHRSARDAITGFRPRITERYELELCSEISLEIDTNAGRLVEVVVDAHFRNCVPADHEFSPSSSPANFIGNLSSAVPLEWTSLHSRHDDNASRSIHDVETESRWRHCFNWVVNYLTEKPFVHTNRPCWISKGKRMQWLMRRSARYSLRSRAHTATVIFLS